MITCKEWADACKKNEGVFYYNDNGICHVNASGTRLFFDGENFCLDFGFDSRHIDDFYKTEKECASAFINEIKTQYGV